MVGRDVGRVRKQSVKKPGTVAVISHNRAFLEKVAADVIVFDEGRLRYFPCGLYEYETTCKQRLSWQERMYCVRVRQEQEALQAAEAMRLRAKAG